MSDQDVEKRLESVEHSLQEIKFRNDVVGLDKGWEVSLSRKLIITLLTYMIIVTYMYAAQIPSPWLNSIVPAVAFMLSTLTLPVFKKIWINKTKQTK